MRVDFHVTFVEKVKQTQYDIVTYSSDMSYTSVMCAYEVFDLDV